MKYLYIMHDDKFIEPYIKSIEKYFNFKDHKFIILSKNNRNRYYSKKNIFLYHSKKSYFKILKELYLSDNIILHSLFVRKIIIILFFQPWLLKKCKWVLWGGDLYSYKKYKQKKKWKSKIYEFMRATVIKNIEGIITYIKEIII